jgi:hypothetical protein
MELIFPVFRDVCKSLVAVGRYNSSPTSVTIGEEALQPSDMPLITICSDPPLKANVVEQHFCKVAQWAKDQDETADVPEDQEDGYCTENPLRLSITLLQKLAERNVCIDGFISAAGLTVLERGFACSSISGMHQQGNSVGGNECSCQHNCSWNVDRARDFLGSQVEATTVGQWESRFYVDSGLPPGLRACSTFKPNVTNKKMGNSGRGYSFQLELNRTEHYNLQFLT